MQAVICAGMKAVCQSSGAGLLRGTTRFAYRAVRKRQYVSLFLSYPDVMASANSVRQPRLNWRKAVFLVSAGTYFYYLYHSNCQDALKQQPFSYDGKLKLMDRQKLVSYNGTSGGRSQGGYLTDGVRIFHNKTAFSEQAAIHELLAGNLMHAACPEWFPEVYVAQTIHEDGSATFSLLSEVKPCAIKDQQNQVIANNLEEFILLLTVPQEVPDNLGVAIAGHAIVGNSDSKLANIVYSALCYPVDFEGAGNQELKTFRLDDCSPDHIIETLAEYQPDTDRLSASLYEDARVEDFDAHHPLIGNVEVLQKFRGWLVASVKNDIQSGRIEDFYHRLGSLTDQQLAAVVESVPFLQRSEKSKQWASDFVKQIRDRASRRVP